MMQLCTFRLGDRWFGVDTSVVQEVLRDMPCTPVPLAPQAVRGLANLRGEIVTVVDLAERLGIAGHRRVEPPFHVVLVAGSALVSLLVDAMGDVVAAADATFERPPDGVDEAARRFIAGVALLDGRLVMVLDATHAAEGEPEPVGVA